MRKYNNKYGDQKLVFLLIIVFGVSAALFGGYKILIWMREGSEGMKTQEMKRTATVESYDTPEAVAEYVLYWIHKGDLDLALRGCAIEEVAEYFSLQSYCEIMDEYEGTENLAPADHDNTAFMEINKIQMTAVYSDMVEQCIGLLGDGYELQVMDIYADVPEDADGYYYQDIRDICAIVGAREACDVVIEMKINGMPYRMTVTAVRYKEHWKILQFSAYENYRYEEPQLEAVINVSSGEELAVMWEAMQKQILPVNYKVAGDDSEEEIETLLRRWFLYIQRGDMIRAVSYFDIYDSKAGLHPDSNLFEIQNQKAKLLQQMYYKLFLHDQDALSWIMQNPKEEAENLLRLLSDDDMFLAELAGWTVLEQNDEYAKYEIKIRQSVTRTYIMEFVYRNGWKISHIE